MTVARLSPAGLDFYERYIKRPDCQRSNTCLTPVGSTEDYGSLAYRPTYVAAAAITDSTQATSPRGAPCSYALHNPLRIHCQHDCYAASI